MRQIYLLGRIILSSARGVSAGSRASMKVIGLMSGTSADGVDAAVVDIAGTGHKLRLKLVAFRTFSYPPDFRGRLLDAMADGGLPEICHLHAALGEWFARAALRVRRLASLSIRDVALIGSHGQTFQHAPIPRREPGVGAIRSTLQLGSPSVIAERTGIQTVADFRTRDMATGGQGAPLAPYLHYLLFQDPRRTRAVVNIGGISNLTFLPATGSLRMVKAFDTGPGNMILDGLIRHLTNDRETFDRGGRLAAKGRVHQGLLKRMHASSLLATTSAQVNRPGRIRGPVLTGFDSRWAAAFGDRRRPHGHGDCLYRADNSGW